MNILSCFSCCLLIGFHEAVFVASLPSDEMRLIVPDGSSQPSPLNQIWSSFMNISLDPANLIPSTQSKMMKVPPASQRLLEFGMLDILPLLRFAGTTTRGHSLRVSLFGMIIISCWSRWLCGRFTVWLPGDDNMSRRLCDRRCQLSYHLWRRIESMLVRALRGRLHRVWYLWKSMQLWGLHHFVSKSCRFIWCLLSKISNSILRRSCRV